MAELLVIRLDMHDNGDELIDPACIGEFAGTDLKEDAIEHRLALEHKSTVPF